MRIYKLILQILQAREFFLIPLYTKNFIQITQMKQCITEFNNIMQALAIVLDYYTHIFIKNTRKY